jgi:Domain of unknown function (DUF4129)
MHPIPEPRNRALTICLVVLVSLTCLARAGAATLADYRQRVSQAIAVIEQLQGAYDDEDPSQRQQFINTSVARIREDLPARETLMLSGQSIVVDNDWLHEALHDYEVTNSTKPQRAEALARIEERLRALSERMEELQRGMPAASDKDSDKGRLAEILRRQEYNKSTAAEGSALGRLWDRFLRWFFSLFPKSRPITPGGSPFVSTFVQIVLIAACVTAIAFFIWRFAPRYLTNRRGKKKPKREARIVLGERLEPDQTAADLLAQAEALARSGDLRAAIRKAYIALLCELGDRKVVSLAQHKTNRDYLNSVRERTRLYTSMRQLTSSFELHWYGFQPAAENDWNEFRSIYQQALKASPGG